MRSDNKYAELRGLNNSDSDYREQDRDIVTVSSRAPEPDPTVAGPALFNLVQETSRAIHVQSALIKAAIPLLNNRIVVDRQSGQTDANGNADIILYRVPQGMQFVTTRVVVEDAGHTAGTPFSAAGAWIALINGSNYGPGSIRDFAPNPPNAAATPVIPWVFSDGDTEAAVFRGGEIITLHVVGTATLANVDIWVSLQGHEFPV